MNNDLSSFFFGVLISGMCLILFLCGVSVGNDSIRVETIKYVESGMIPYLVKKENGKKEIEWKSAK